MGNEFTVAVYKDGEKVQGTRIPKEGLAIGRSRSNGLVLADPHVSKLHVRLVPSGEQLIVTDLDSASGTIVKGRKVTVTTLKSGDELRVGPYVLRVLSTADSPSHSTPPAPTHPPAGSGLRQLVHRLSDLTTLSGVTDLQAVLESLLDQTMKLFDAPRGFIVLAHDGVLSPVLVRHGGESATDERFSRTVCQRAMEARHPFRLETSSDSSQLDAIKSLNLENPALVLAIPLLTTEEVHGVLYLEAKLGGQEGSGPNEPLLEEVAHLGGYALKVAREHHQIIGDRDRWQWLAAIANEEPDLFRSSRSPQMEHVLDIVQQTAAEDVTALILGESGVGKEVAALTIHRISARSRGPFTAINCGAIPKDLLESELFGYEPGAFTGATARKPGRLELAQGGTLLLDELGDLPLDLQVKLLRVLETRTFERLGGSLKIRWDARLLGATNRDLQAAVAAGQFRADLYYRLNVVSIELPPLRQRKEDIESLVHEILLVSNRRFRRKLYGVTPEALQMLQNYAWPGNVRELRNIMERAFILEKSDWITPASLPFAPQTAPVAGPKGGPPVDARTAPESELYSLEHYLIYHERLYIQQVLERVDGHVTQAAKLLGQSRTAFHRRLRQLGLRGSSAPDEPE